MGASLAGWGRSEALSMAVCAPCDLNGEGRVAASPHSKGGGLSANNMCCFFRLQGQCRHVGARARTPQPRPGHNTAARSLTVMADSQAPGPSLHYAVAVARHQRSPTYSAWVKDRS